MMNGNTGGNNLPHFTATAAAAILFAAATIAEPVAVILNLDRVQNLRSIHHA